MDPIDPQRAAIQEAYTVRFRKRAGMMVFIVVTMTALSLTKDSTTVYGIPATVFGPVSVGLLFAGWVLFDIYVWRCPACDKNLGRPINPRRCRHCGVELRG